MVLSSFSAYFQPISGAVGYIYDYMDQYRNQATFVSNGLTFQEAYERTGRRPPSLSR